MRGAFGSLASKIEMEVLRARTDNVQLDSSLANVAGWRVEISDVDNSILRTIDLSRTSSHTSDLRFDLVFCNIVQIPEAYMPIWDFSSRRHDRQTTVPNGTISLGTLDRSL